MADFVDPQEPLIRRALGLPPLTPPILATGRSIPMPLPLAPRADTSLTPTTLDASAAPATPTIAAGAPALKPATLTPPDPNDPRYQLHGAKKVGIGILGALAGLGGHLDAARELNPYNRAVDAFNRNLATQKEQASIEDTRSQTAERERKANEPYRPETIDQEYADAVTDAINRGVDPASDPKVSQIASAAQKLKPGAEPKTVETGDGVYQFNPATQRFDIKVGAAKTTKDTATQEDERYEKIQTDLSMKKAVPAEDRAWAKAYEKRKTLAPATTTSGADVRQAKTEQFQQQETGRKFLSEKIEQPYIDAREKADNLRGAVQAAKSGNMIAGSLQPLLATLGVTTMEGVKRINTTELETVAGAGDLWTKIKGQAGKLKEGQPVPANLQKDIVSLANMLEQSAYKKYSEGFSRTKKRYGLDDEEPMVGPGGATASPAAGNRPPLSSFEK